MVDMDCGTESVIDSEDVVPVWKRMCHAVITMYKALFRLGVRAWAQCSGTKMPVVHTYQCLEINDVLNYPKIGVKFVMVPQQVVRKCKCSVHCENLSRLVPVPRHGARVLPLKLVPVPGHGAQQKVLSKRLCLDWRPGTKSEQGRSGNILLSLPR